ncbi:hypothetical protein PENANT_c017G04228 [Penicillium antarcticum]|uniref:Zn(II)2Cys6 transcription factor n=1 Tax=Penicillium antarcticum TaxID=416450 RepID=A0A1V6Q1Y2_9EURO|nr:hypothetical protein PENANT_c017G04228 [Penicillium antarcticum]
MQRMQHQPVIRNALVALSSLYKDFLQPGRSCLSGSPQHIVIITKAHKQLRTHLLSRDASPEVALICSLIFYILECLVGNSQQAIWHLDQGLILLQRCQREYPGAVSAPEFGHLMAVFSRLDIHASIFDSERVPVLNIVKSLGFLPTVPDAFVDLSDAEQSLTVMENRLMHHIISSLEHREKAEEEIPSDIIQERHQLKIQFQRLECVIENLLLAVQEEAQNLQRQQRVLLLHIQAMIFHAALLENLCLYSDNTNLTIDANRRFHLALSKIKTLLLSCPESHSTSSNREFTLSTNIIAVLYYICMKTKNHRILKTALSLIQGCSVSTRDGLWDASTAASVVQSLVPCDSHEDDNSEMIKLEDVGAGIVDTSGGLEEAFRLLRIMESSGPEIINIEAA